MVLVAVLLAFTVGAVAAPAMSVFRFIALLTMLLVFAILAAMATSDDTGSAIARVVALFAAAQVGYGFGLAALSKLCGPRGPTRRRRPRSRK